jgi:hypothetical protein
MTLLNELVTTGYVETLLVFLVSNQVEYARGETPGVKGKPV